MHSLMLKLSIERTQHSIDRNFYEKFQHIISGRSKNCVDITVRTRRRSFFAPACTRSLFFSSLAPKRDVPRLRSIRLERGRCGGGIKPPKFKIRSQHCTYSVAKTLVSRCFTTRRRVLSPMPTTNRQEASGGRLPGPLLPQQQRPRRRTCLGAAAVSERLLPLQHLPPPPVYSAVAAAALGKLLHRPLPQAPPPPPPRLAPASEVLVPPQPPLRLPPLPRRLCLAEASGGLRLLLLLLRPPRRVGLVGALAAPAAQRLRLLPRLQRGRGRRLRLEGGSGRLRPLLVLPVSVHRGLGLSTRIDRVLTG